MKMNIIFIRNRSNDIKIGGIFIKQNIGLNFRSIGFPLILLVLFFTLSGCQSQNGKAVKPNGNTGKNTGKTEINRENLREFTPEDLARYDGSGGNPAYIAINGIVYDVTNAKGWRNGIHTPLSTFTRLAGDDLTDDWEKVPDSHKKRKYLDDLPVVGRLKEIRVNLEQNSIK